MARNKPMMSRVRRYFLSAALLPIALIILIVTISLFSVATMPRDGESGYSITIYLLLLFGIPMTLLGMVGGLVAAAITDQVIRR
ncbi:MAG: hypothetical protein HOP96_02375 [Sphingomonas sp.]|nr:hypothetical protein [Sphingomonas sp.]